MLESELSQLFNEEELIKFKEFMLDSGYFWLGKESYCQVMYIQEFINQMEDDDRIQEILEICVNKFLQIIGFEKENI